MDKQKEQPSITFARDEELSQLGTPTESRGAYKGSAIKALRLSKSEWDVLDAHGFRYGVRIADRKQQSTVYRSLYERLRAANDSLPRRITIYMETHGRNNLRNFKSIELTMTKVRDIPSYALGNRPDLSLGVWFEAPDFKTMKTERR